MDLSAMERSFLEQMRALAVDTAGVETLVGLDAAESIEYMEYARLASADALQRRQRTRYIELSDRHQHARIERIAIAIELKLADPARS